MLDVQKITTHMPKALLAEAQRLTGRGITETVREGLELLVQRQTSRQLRGFRGKVKLDIDLQNLREDR